MAIGDKYLVTLNITHTMTVDMMAEMMMTQRGFDPTVPADVLEFYRENHLNVPDMAIWHTMMHRAADPATWPQGAKLVANEITVTGPT